MTVEPIHLHVTRLEGLSAIDDILGFAQVVDLARSSPAGVGSDFRLAFSYSEAGGVSYREAGDEREATIEFREVIRSEVSDPERIETYILDGFWFDESEQVWVFEGTPALRIRVFVRAIDVVVDVR